VQQSHFKLFFIKMKKLEEDNKQKLINRISRIEGQLRGVKRMVLEKGECVDIISQIKAIREAAAMLGVLLLKDDFSCKRREGEKINEQYLKTLFKIK